MKNKTKGHLRRLVKSWRDTGLLEGDEFKFVKEDIEIFIRLEERCTK